MTKRNGTQGLASYYKPALTRLINTRLRMPVVGHFFSSRHVAVDMEGSSDVVAERDSSVLKTIQESLLVLEQEVSELKRRRSRSRSRGGRVRLAAPAAAAVLTATLTVGARLREAGRGPGKPTVPGADAPGAGSQGADAPRGRLGANAPRADDPRSLLGTDAPLTQALRHAEAQSERVHSEIRTGEYGWITQSWTQWTIQRW